MRISSKLPHVGTTIFSVMSALAREHQAINLSQGFPNFDCDDRLKGLVNTFIQKGYNQYAPMPGVPELRQKIAQKANTLYNCLLDPDKEITVTAGATQALFTALAAFIRPGDEVIIIEPAYDAYQPGIEVFGAKAVSYELKAPDYEVNWNSMSALISDRTKAIMINTPHNPTGKVLTQNDLEQLQMLVEGTDILVISDEVYEHLIFDNEQHQSVLRFPELYKRSVLTFSFGKTFHNTGWKVGYAIAPPELTEEFRKVHQYNVFSVNTPVQYALAAYLEEPAHYLDLGPFYQEKRDYFLEILKETPFELIPCKGSYFQMASYAGISDQKDVDFTRWMIEEIGVATIPVSAFYASRRDDHVIRFCFAKTKDVLDAAGQKLRTLK